RRTSPDGMAAPATRGHGRADAPRTPRQARAGVPNWRVLAHRSRELAAAAVGRACGARPARRARAWLAAVRAASPPLAMGLQPSLASLVDVGLDELRQFPQGLLPAEGALLGGDDVG